MENSNNNAKAGENVFSIKDFLVLCIEHWQWFLYSLIIFMCMALLYLYRAQPVYSRTESVLIEDQEAGGGALDVANAFSSLGFMSTNSKVKNELYQFTSPAVMAEVVSRLNLQQNYAIRTGFLRWASIYGSDTPVVVDFPGLSPDESVGFKVEINPDGTFEIVNCYKFTEDGKESTDVSIKGKVGYSKVKTPIGPVEIKPNPAYGEKLEETVTMKIGRRSFADAVEKYAGRLNGTLADDEADVINLNFEDVSVQRATDILNMVVTVYNENWVRDKNQISIATSNFIDERIVKLEQELGNVDTEISSYKANNMVPDIEETAKLYLQESSKQEQEILEVTNMLAMATYIRDFLRNPANKFGVLPMNTGIESPQLEVQIANYNNILLARNNMVANSSETNPIVKDYDVQLAGLRETVMRSINTHISALNSTLKNMNASRAKNEARIASTPTQAKFLISVERKQQVIESLYLFLLQKREENELSQKFSAYNTRVITPPYGPQRPVSPKKGLILVAAFILGLAVPGVILYVSSTNDSKVRSRKDLETLPVPFAGEIPQIGKQRKWAKYFRSKKANQKIIDTPVVIVKEGCRDVPNEAFRVLRSNIDMMAGKDKGCRVMLLTSFNPGSGKSFISYNLGLSFGLKRRRVLMIEGDLRHGSLSNFVGSPHHGITDYLTEKQDDWKKLLVKAPECEYVDVLPLGHMPPNPAELLENGRLGELVEEARAEYDYVFIDCPPIDIVVDTQIIEKYTDRSIFVLRAGLLDKRALVEIREIYDNKKYKHMSMILNGTDTAHSRYYSYGTYESVTSKS